MEDAAITGNDQLKNQLHNDYDPLTFNGRINTSEVDVYLCLLVYSLKPHYLTCAGLYDKYEVGDKGYMSYKEWLELCRKAPIDVPSDMQVKIWRLLAWRSGDRCPLADFVAVWHLHDLEVKDPWVERITDVLKLEYYKLNLEELQRKISSKVRILTPIQSIQLMFTSYLFR